jgi:predicted neutral ceramidase superfamily lipid hydrolase
MDMRDSKNTHPDMGKKHYIRLLIMAVSSFISMYILMYAMVDKFDNVYPNLNQFYMAALMTAPMVIIELALMSSMFQQKKWNILIIAFSVTLLVGSFIFIRQQTAINDEQFLKSMISHHASAILMCEEASITDPEIKELCNEILANQQSEIDEMKAKLSELRE